MTPEQQALVDSILVLRDLGLKRREVLLSQIKALQKEDDALCIALRTAYQYAQDRWHSLAEAEARKDGA